MAMKGRTDEKVHVSGIQCRKGEVLGHVSIGEGPPVLKKTGAGCETADYEPSIANPSKPLESMPRKTKADYLMSRGFDFQSGLKSCTRRLPLNFDW